jgi:ubiquitin-activating enzyme E1
MIEENKTDEKQYSR